MMAPASTAVVVSGGDPAGGTHPGFPAPVTGPGRISAAGLLCFAAGAAQILKFNLVGEIYGGELLLPLAAVAAFAGRRELPLLSSVPLRRLLLCLGLTLLGYVISDLAAGTPPELYVKGWGRIAVIGIDIVCLAVVIARDRRNLWWLVAGAAIGGIAYLRLIEGKPLGMWKFHYAEPMVLLAAAAAGFLDRRLAAAWFAALAYYSFTHDFRTFGGFNLVFAAVALASGRGGQGTRPDRSRILRVAAGVALAALAAKFALSELGGDYWAQRRAASDAGRSAAIEVGIEAVMRSPVIGYGSWMHDRELARLQARLMREKTGWIDREARKDEFHPHSQVLQAWAEGGMFGAAFFLLLLFQVPVQLYWLLVRRPADRMTYVYLYFLVTGAWNVINSPIGASLRLHLAIVAVCTATLALERAGADRAARAARRSRSGDPPFHNGRFDHGPE